MSEQLSQNPENSKPASELTIPQLALALRALGETMPDGSEIIAESAKKLDQLQNIGKLLGLLAPGGTAPRTAFEQIWDESSSRGDEFPVLLELRDMLQKHWGEWTPAIREAEGLPPTE
jgi:hypothetical protein